MSITSGEELQAKHCVLIHPVGKRHVFLAHAHQLIGKYRPTSLAYHRDSFLCLSDVTQTFH